MEINQFITVQIETWKNGILKLENHRTIVLDICNDPLKINEPKCGIIINNEEYGIPFSEILKVEPANGQQLSFF